MLIQCKVCKYTIYKWLQAGECELPGRFKEGL
jgi:hypothetical protein